MYYHYKALKEEEGKKKLDGGKKRSIDNKHMHWIDTLDDTSSQGSWYSICIQTVVRLEQDCHSRDSETNFEKVILSY
jgi:hypothetical protein